MAFKNNEDLAKAAYIGAILDHFVDPTNVDKIKGFVHPATKKTLVTYNDLTRITDPKGNIRVTIEFPDGKTKIFERVNLALDKNKGISCHHVERYGRYWGLAYVLFRLEWGTWR